MRARERLLPVACLLMATATACAAPSTQQWTPSPAPRWATIAASSATAVLSTGMPAAAAQSTLGSGFCAAEQPRSLIERLRSALLTSNGPGLASLVSPVHGMDVRLFRNGRAINYDAEHARFLFESNFSVDWGAAPGSGLETAGSFDALVVPALLAVFSRDYVLTCNQVQVGAASYHAGWPYQGINFYSAHYPGTAANGNLDWRTWVLGLHDVSGQAYLYSLVPFQWEP